MTAALDAALRLAWHPHAVGRPPLTWPHVLVHPEARPVAPTLNKAEAVRIEQENARQLAEAMQQLCAVWRIGQPPRWTGPRRVIICADDMPVRAQREAA